MKKIIKGKIVMCIGMDNFCFIEKGKQRYDIVDLLKVFDRQNVIITVENNIRVKK